MADVLTLLTCCDDGRCHANWHHWAISNAMRTTDTCACPDFLDSHGLDGDLNPLTV